MAADNPPSRGRFPRDLTQPRAPIDWGQSIYHASGGGLRFSRLLVLRVARAYCADRLGTIDLPCQRRSSMVELLSPIALPRREAEASYGFRGCWSDWSRELIALRSIGDNRSTSRSNRSRCLSRQFAKVPRQAQGASLWCRLFEAEFQWLLAPSFQSNNLV